MSLLRLAQIAAAAVLLSSSAVPALAGATQDAVLAKYAGTWNGSGQLAGAETGKITCKLTFKQLSSKLLYTGRCSYSGGPGSSSFSGSLSYSDAHGRYEALSNGGVFAGTASNGGVVFNMSQHDMRGNFTSTLSLTGGTIKFDVKIVESSSGDTTRAHVPFTRA